MKKIKHITLNLTEDDYNSLLFIANNQRRTATQTAYLILIDNLNKLVLTVANIQTEFKKIG